VVAVGLVEPVAAVGAVVGAEVVAAGVQLVSTMANNTNRITAKRTFIFFSP
jgi:hypothetical protein